MIYPTIFFAVDNSRYNTRNGCGCCASSTLYNPRVTFSSTTRQTRCKKEIRICCRPPKIRETYIALLLKMPIVMIYHPKNKRECKHVHNDADGQNNNTSNVNQLHMRALLSIQFYQNMNKDAIIKVAQKVKPWLVQYSPSRRSMQDAQ